MPAETEMRTTVDIPRELLEEAMRRTGAKTKQQAVLMILTDWLRQQRLKELASERETVA
jgi:Arc/MetJ family transcription regulator